MAIKNHTWVTSLIAGALSLNFSCHTLAEASTEEQEPQTEKISVLPLEDLQVFTKAFDHIRNSYVEEISDSKLLEYAIRGMIAELDPHSVYLDAEQFEDMRVHTTGQFGGLGIEVGMENGFVKVISPIDDTPAAKAGILAGDLIIKLDDTAVKGLDLGEAVDIMRGEKGTKITLTVVREGIDQPFEITITRDIIKVRSVRSEIKEKDFGYIRIAQFQSKTAEDVRKAYDKLVSENDDLKGLILDLRNNPGGVLRASVDVADHFLEKGLIVYTEGRMNQADIEYEATPGDITDNLPIVVLINEGSASASEIVSGALQDHQRAIIMGERSFGKGSVQTIIPITNERAIKITTARYFTPSGRSIQAEGIEPDINIGRVHVTAVKKGFSVSESELKGHLSNGKKKRKDKDKEETDEQDSADLQNSDNQLFEAITLLKGINLFQRSQQQKAEATEGTEEETP